MSYTPGPWRELVTRIDDARGYQICHLDLHGKSEAERDANRRLIAAAPAMLEALESMVDWLDDGNRILSDSCAADVTAARAAIKAAKGEA